MVLPIVYPLHSKGGKLQNDIELKLSLRSLARHLKVPFKVVIAGERLPSWGTNIELLHLVGGLKAALRAVAEAFPDGFFWIYDDCCLLKDTDAELLKITPACKGWPQLTKTNWAGMLNEIHERLRREGILAIDYSRPHGPYWLDKGMVDEGFADWPGMSGKFPWESWILSKRTWPKRHGVVKQYYGPFNSTRALKLPYRVRVLEPSL